MNWGWGIVWIFGAFIALMFYFFFRALNVETNMVRTDYYQEESEVNKANEQIINFNKLGKSIILELSNSKTEILIQFPHVPDSGRVWLYRPSNSKLDQDLKFMGRADSTVVLKSRSLVSGNWKVKIYWSIGATQYYHEKSLQVE
jgi:nitrogen fixation protein FixH